MATIFLKHYLLIWELESKLTVAIVFPGPILTLVVVQIGHGHIGRPNQFHPGLMPVSPNRFLGSEAFSDLHPFCGMLWNKAAIGHLPPSLAVAPHLPKQEGGL